MSKATSVYQVAGMTCGHCVAAVSGEVGRLVGVTAVDVDLAGGTVTVTSDGPVDDAAVRAAVDEAGYEVVGPGAAPHRAGLRVTDVSGRAAS